MNIGFDAKRFFHNNTGLGNYSRDLVRILSEYYPDNSYILYNTKPNLERSKLLNSSNTKERLPQSFLEKKLKSVWRMWWVNKQIQQDKIGVYHGLSGEIPIRLPQGVKRVVTIHDLIFVRYPHLYSWFDRKIHFQKFKYAAHQADVVIAISEQTKRDIVAFLKVHPDKIKVVYQGCSDVFKKSFSTEQKHQVQAKYNLPKHFLLNVGTIETRKNALMIVKAIKDIDTTLVLIGRKTKYYEEIQSYIDQHHLQHKVLHLSGLTQEELAIIYQLSTVFVYPSVFEGFGIPIIEALFSKTPVITTNSGVFPEAGGPSSKYIDPNSSEELSQVIRTLLQDETLRIEMAEKGYHYAQQFTDKQIAEQLINVYSNL